MLKKRERLEGVGDDRSNLFLAVLVTTVTREPPQLDEGDEPVRGGILKTQSTAALIVDGSYAPLKWKMPLDMDCILNGNGKDLDSLGCLKQTIDTESDGRLVRSRPISVRPHWWTILTAAASKY
jgi:hypothetical protein